MLDGFGVEVAKSSQTAEVKTARLVMRLRRQRAVELADAVETFALRPAAERMRAGVPKQGKNYTRMSRRFLLGDKARPRGAEASLKRRFALPAHRAAFESRVAKGLPSALRGANGMAAADRAFDSLDALPKKTQVRILGGMIRRGIRPKHLKDEEKHGGKVLGAFLESLGTHDKPSAYLMSRAVRNEAGRERMPGYRNVGGAARDWEKKQGFVAKFDRRLLALAVPVGAAAAVPFWKQTPDDHGASERIARRRLPTAKTSDLRAVARGNGFRIGEKDHVARLAHSMRTEGFRPSEPIVVERYKNGKMLIRGGHHRLAAAEQAGLRRVPIRVEGSDKPAPRSLVTLATARQMDKHVLRARVPYKREKDRVPPGESAFTRTFNRTVSRIDATARE